MVHRNIVGSIERQIRKLGDLLGDSGLLIDRNYPYRFRIGRQITRLAWNNYYIAGLPEFASIEEYLWFMGNKQYSFILFDGSLIQISYDFRHREIIGHHLGLYPSPVPIDTEELHLYYEYGYTMEDLIHDKLVSSNVRMKSPIRFDFDKNDNRENHAASHLHISQDNCRIPVFAPLSLGLFIRFIFCNFYPEHWDSHQFIRTWPQQIYDSSIMTSQKKQIHINCAR